jgi:4-amino-4-deoxy-L-arabinose transferase-like glycosyltransferase
MPLITKNPLLLISLFLVPVIAGIFFVFLTPLYQGPDEQIHYATLQYRAEPSNKDWVIETTPNDVFTNDADDITSFHLSEEAIQLGKLSYFDEVKWQEENTQRFSDTTMGTLEDKYPVNTSPNTSYYYWVTSALEQFFFTSNVIERFFAMRIFSFLLYLGTVVIAFLIARKLFTSTLQQTLFAIIVALHPMLLATGTIVNIDIALIFGTSLFFLAALMLLEKPTLTNHLLTLGALAIAFLGKAPGIAFLPVLAIIYLYLLQQKYQLKMKSLLWLTLFTGLAITFLFFALVPDTTLQTFLNLQSQSKFSSPVESITTYADKTLGIDTFRRTHTSYWGNFGWLDTKISEGILDTLLALEALGFLGIFFYFITRTVPDYFPKKSAIVLALGMMFFLQLAIRFYDWRVFDTFGKIIIGAPGRYFLPTLIPHLLVVVTGLGFLFTKEKSQFTTLLKVLSLGMILLCLYSVFSVIIPRYYL